MQLGLNLAAATFMVAITTLMHFIGLLLLMRFMSKAHAGLRSHPNRVWQASMIMIAVLGLFALHTAEIWSYAALYRLLGELKSFEEALYFATVTFVSLGYGDVVLSPTWRVLSGIEGANGVILIAWSTAFLLSVTNRLKVLEHDWLDRGDR